jgi:hypothetical protein
MSTFLSPFPCQLSTSSLSSILIVLRRFFTWTVHDDAVLRFTLILVTNPTFLKGELYQPRNQSTHVTDGVAGTSLSANLEHKFYANLVKRKNRPNS